MTYGLNKSLDLESTKVIADESPARMGVVGAVGIRQMFFLDKVTEGCPDLEDLEGSSPLVVGELPEGSQDQDIGGNGSG